MPISSIPSPPGRIEPVLNRRIRSAGALARSALRGIALAVVLFAFVSPLTSQESGNGAMPGADSPAVRAQKLCIQTEASFILNRDRAKARQGFLNATQIDADYAPGWFDLGVLAEGDKNWAKAAGYFRQYLSLQPAGADADRAKAQLQLVSRYLDGSATPEMARSMEYDASIQRARAFLAHGYYKESIAEAGHAESLDASRWEAYAVVSLCMARQNKPQEAVKFEALAIERAPVNKRDQIRSALSPRESRRRK